MTRLLASARERAGVAPLVPHPWAVNAAQSWSETLASDRDLRHSPRFIERALEGMRASFVGENVAKARDVQSAFELLYESPGHRANMLDARFTHLGIAAVKGQKGYLWITQVFGQVPPKAPPAKKPAVPAAPAEPVPKTSADPDPAASPPAPEPDARPQMILEVASPPSGLRIASDDQAPRSEGISLYPLIAVLLSLTTMWGRPDWR